MFFWHNWNEEPEGDVLQQPEKTGFARLWEVLEDSWGTLLKANLLFVACCIPVVTIPLAILAMTYVLRRRILRMPRNCFHDFRTAINRYWKQAYAAFFLTGGLLTVSGVGGWFYLQRAGENILFFLPFLICSTVFLVALLSAVYLYGFLVDGLGVRESARLALICGVARPLRAIGAAACSLGLTLAAILALPFSLTYLLAIGFSVPCLLGQFLARTLLPQKKSPADM